MAANGGYNNKGLYNSYDKNHRERQAEDYYATNPAEVYNILDTLGIDLSGKTILEPCVGGGHMADAILKYCNDNNMTPNKLIGTDIKDRGYKNENWELHYGSEYDYFSDTYEPSEADIIILNPPYGVIEPFTIRTLEIAKEKVIMLARWQFFEGASRYKNILSVNPPNEAWIYIDRIQCWKNGIDPGGSSAQAYCWVVWDKTKPVEDGTVIHYLHRSNKI